MSAVDLITRALRESRVAPVAAPDATDPVAPVAHYEKPSEINEVAPVAPGSIARATAFSEQKQGGSTGSTGSTAKTGSEAANEPDADDHQADLDEACEERAAILEHDGGLDRAEAERIAQGAARDYYNHVMRQLQTRCGCRTTGWTAARVRLCPEGQRLKDAYHAAVKEAAA